MGQSTRALTIDDLRAIVRNNPSIAAAIATSTARNAEESSFAVARLIMDNPRLVDAVVAAGMDIVVSGRQINESMANGVTQAFDRFAQSVAQGKNVFKSLGQAFLQFAADFLRQITLMIIQQIAFNAVSGGAPSGGGAGTGNGGAGGGIAGVIGGLFHHDGGVVGRDGTKRLVDAGAWAGNILRYHGGGIAGLRPDEVPAVLQRGEEVLTASDPRHRDNGGQGGRVGGNVKLVNLFDREAAIQEMLNTPAGERAILNVVQNNPAAFKSALG